MTRSVAVVAGVLLLAAPAGAVAVPSLTIEPQKRCYSHGERVNLLGTGFTPSPDPLDPMKVRITRDGTLVGPLDTSATGAFNAFLTLGQSRGRETRTYTATDRTDPSLTASDQITVSAVRVGLKPDNGAPGRVMAITARGFTTGKTLWAHVTRGGSTRNLKLGRLEGACGGLETRRRLLPRNAALGVHRIQFDTFHRFSRRRPVQDSATVAVSRG